MRWAAAKKRSLFSLAALCVLAGTLVAPAPALATRTLAGADGRDLAPTPDFDRVLAQHTGSAVEHVDRLPLYTALDVVTLAFCSTLEADQVEATVARQRHRLHLLSRQLARSDELDWGRKTATGVSSWTGVDNYRNWSQLKQKTHRPSYQGLWTDPVTGIAYARNRWYDMRSASWLSEDPMGAVDSPNLYAFVGWGPHESSDPYGLQSPDSDACIPIGPAVAPQGYVVRDALERAVDAPDMALRGGFLQCLALAGQLRGYGEAARNLRFYLDEDNPGARLVKPEWLKMFPEVSSGMAQGETELRGQAAAVALSLRPGDTLSRWHSDYASVPVTATSYSDLYWASGSSSLQMRLANATFNRDDDGVTVKGTLFYYWTDEYNWDAGKFIQPLKDVPILKRTSLGAWKIYDEEIDALATHEKAKNFALESLWTEDVEYKMSVTDWQQLLPDPTPGMTDEELKTLIDSGVVVDVVGDAGQSEDGR